MMSCLGMTWRKGKRFEPLTTWVLIKRKAELDVRGRSVLYITGLEVCVNQGFDLLDGG